MRCLYCGKQLALFRRLTGGGEFCSDAHKESYHEEFNRLALARLKQAQEKSDELRAAAPQNQLALIRRGPGEPAGPTIRSNAHWVEQKANRTQPHKTLALASPEAAGEPLSPKPAEFLTGMPQPAQTALVVQTALDPATIEARVESRMPEWSPPLVPLELPAAGEIESTLPPLPRTHEIQTAIPVPAAVEMISLNLAIPQVVMSANSVPVYKDQPAVEIDPLQFAPKLVARLETFAQFLPLKFEFTAFTAPDFDILEPAEMPSPQLKVRPAAALKRTDQEPMLAQANEPDQPVRRKGAASARGLELATIGEIAALASPMTPLYPKSAGPAEARPQLGVFNLPPPTVVIPRSAVLAFRADDKVAPAADPGEPDVERPSSLKVKLAAMAPPLPVPAPPVVEQSKPMVRTVAMPSRTAERKPVERSAPAAAATSTATPRRRTVPFPSILELPVDTGDDEQKSLWGALRRYLKK